MESASVLQAEDILKTLLIIFFLGTLGGKLAEKFRIPDVVVYIIIGLLIGPGVFGLVHVSANSTMNQFILLFGASFILFDGGVGTHLSVLKKVWRSVTLLATLGVVVTALVTGLAATWLFHLTLVEGLLLGSIIASTDPAALVPIFRKFPVRPKVAHTVVTESAFNDAVGAILTTVVFGILTAHGAIHWGAIGGQFLLLAGGGIVVGVIVGGISALLISENDRGLLQGFTPMVAVLTVLAAYMIAVWIGASGFMSVFSAGLILGNADVLRLKILPEQEHALHQFIEPIGLKMRMLIFILLGSQVDFTVLREYGGLGVVVVLIFMLVARPLSVLASLLPDRKAQWERNEILFMFWTRETGVIPAALVGMIAGSNLASGKLIAAVVFVTILMTLVLQASTTPFVAKKLGLLEHQDRPAENDT